MMGVGSQLQEFPWVEFETGSHMRKEGETGERQITPDGWVAGMICKGTAIQGLSWATSRGVNLCTCPQSLVYTES